MENSYDYGSGLYQDGVFYFTNPGLFEMRDRDGGMTKDFTALWNNKEYRFKAGTTVPLVIANEPPENIQHIRKVFAKKYAQAWFHQTERYNQLVEKGKNLPATYDEDTEFGHVIQQCITPLPKSKLEVMDAPRIIDEKNFTATRAVSDKQDLNSVFADYEPPTLGKIV